MFTKEQRIQISRSIVELPRTQETLSNVIDGFDSQIIEISTEDSANRLIMDSFTAIINEYQAESESIEGVVRTQLLELDLLNAVARIPNNQFYPLQSSVSMPSIPDGIWRFLLPFSGSVARGANPDETFGSNPVNEIQTLADIKSIISSINSLPIPERISGLTCNEETSTGSAPITFAVFTPSAAQSLFTSLISELDILNGLLSDQVTSLINLSSIEIDSIRSTQNALAENSINTINSAISTWETFDPFDPDSVVSPIGSCALFDGSDESDFNTTRLTPAILQALSDAVDDREAFILTRTSQLNDNLGTIGQDLTTGDLNGSGSGLYDTRFNSIVTRISLLGGSLVRLSSAEGGVSAQNAIIETNDNTLRLYSNFFTVSAFRSPASNNGTIHLLDASGFSIGDSVFLTGDRQEELSGNILNIENNTVFLDFNVPEKYTHQNLSRVYKLI